MPVPRTGCQVRGVLLAAGAGLLALAAPIRTAGAAPVYKGETPGFELAQVDLGAYVQPWIMRAEEGTRDGTQYTGFGIYRARLETGASFFTTRDARAPDGWTGPSFAAKLNFETTSASLSDAFIEARAGHGLQVRAGRFKTPSSRNLMVSGRRLLLPQLATTTSLAPGRSVGLQLHGFGGEHVFDYAVGVFNGQSPGPGQLYAARVSVQPLGGPSAPVDILPPNWSLHDPKDLPVGAHNPDVVVTLGGHAWVDASAGDDEARTGGGVDVFLHVRELNLSAAVLTRGSLNTIQSDDDLITRGYWVQAGLFPPGNHWGNDHVALVARFEQTQGEPFDIVVAEEDGPLDDTREYTVGVQVFAGQPMFPKLTDARVLLAYTTREEVDGSSYPNDEVVLTGQLGF